MFDESHQKEKKMISILVIFFLMFFNHFFIGSFSKILFNTCVWITYSLILLFPRTWWTKKKIVFAVGILLIETVAGVYWLHELLLIYLLAIIIFYFTILSSLSKAPVPIIVSLFLSALFYIRFGKENAFSIISFILLTIVLYIAIKQRLQRNEMYRVNKQQLEELQSAYEQLQEASVTSMRYAVLEERTRIAREIHDAVGHSLTSLIVQMQALKYMIKKDPNRAEKSIDEMLAVARQGLQDIRTSVHSLADNQLISGITPLKALLSRMKTSASIQYEFHSNLNEEELNSSINELLFKTLREAITNIIRHSQASFVTVRLNKVPGKVIMKIRDNGKLESKDGIFEGFGLKSMRKAIEEKGGKMSYLILEPNGFEITVEIPVDNQNENEG
ncbi:sensor histidine kinase [Neobacillus thermocopriae]|uniref:histidine kinase n=1 Tax=Neobacillus thermocopriae TaxID=1215031 RepID=A0A6B3TS37_9BACI|nr:sensor histidine kinase [Neobacillus thermocopriae]MED3622933.1 sensor histidine kinase [Neobacillus thermocopriae]MED3713207.1 sensor histidine kinase [Neobacillus thermocopriae]NEX79230.1 sensor histidine kinase [Neobacillus thermocopriae]